jgi:hypothetical protein
VNTSESVKPSVARTCRAGLDARRPCVAASVHSDRRQGFGPSASQRDRRGAGDALNSSRVAPVSPTPSTTRTGPAGGRTWWAHVEFTPINIEPTILRKKIEDLRLAAIAPQSSAHIAIVTDLRLAGGALPRHRAGKRSDHAAKLARPISVHERAAGWTLEVVPSFQRFHAAAEHCLPIDERTIARRTEDLRRRRLGH